MTDDLTGDFDRFQAHETEEEAARAALVAGQSEVEEKGNDATCTWVDGTIRTLEELLEKCRVDTSVWKVDHYVCNQWQQGSRSKALDTVVIVPLYQIKAWLSRIVPEKTELPEVQPVEISIGWTGRNFASPSPGRSGVKLALVVPDIQTGFRRDFRTGALDPFHDRRALDVCLQVAEAMQPDVVVYNGDDLDLPDWSDKYVRSPEFFWCTQPALAEAAWWKAQMRMACPDAEIHWIEGNHEARLMKAIINHNMVSYGLRPVDDLDGPDAMSIERLCGLKALGIQYHGPYPTGEVWLGEKFRIIHGEVVRSQSGKTAAKVAEDLRHSEAQGHIHRVEIACKTYWKKGGSRTYMAASFGTMARIAPGVVPGFKHKQNWQNGFGLVEFEDSGEHLYNVRPVLVFDGCTVYDGRRWAARSEEQILEAIEADLGGKVRVR